MEQDTHQTKRHRRAVATTTPPPPPGEVVDAGPQKADYEDHLLTLSKPAGLLIQMVVTQMELIFTTLLSASPAAPSRVAHGGGTALRRVACGLLGAAYACAVLIAALVISVLIGIALVRFWVEEPVSLGRPLYFDYTHAHPVAAVRLRGSGVKGRAIPTGHVARVSLVLFMPESDYNRWIGVFQVTAEVISSSGDIVATSSLPCMLRFQSLPVRLMRTFVMGIPLLTGVSDETQKLAIEVLRYKESNHKTEVIRVRLKPRSGTSDLPQIYSAELIINSQLPRRKELVYNWKWTFYVWISLYVYMMLLIMLVCCFKTYGISRCKCNGTELLPTGNTKDQRYNLSGRGGDFSDEFSDSLMRWRERTKSKRKARFPYVRISEFSEGSASSPTGGEKSEVIDDLADFTASESSVCFGG